MFYTLLGFLIAPQGLVIFFLLFFILPLSFIFWKTKKRYAVLQKHFHGHFSWINGLWFNFLGSRFSFSEQGRSSGSVEYGGIARQPMLWTCAKTRSSFFCGMSDIKKYQFNWNLGSCPYEKMLTLSGKEILIGAETEAFLAMMIESITENIDVARSLGDLVQKPGSYLRVTKEYIVGHGALVSNKTVFRYFIMDKEVYSNPQTLEHSLKNITTVLNGFGVEVERAHE